MSDRTQLPDTPTCGAGALYGVPCDAPATVMVSTSPSAGYSLVVWRCDRHANDPIEIARQFGPAATVSVEAIGPPDTPARPRLSLVPASRHNDNTGRRHAPHR
jgi:hypothetical protein